jgi:hypothetical protein
MLRTSCMEFVNSLYLFYDITIRIQDMAEVTRILATLGLHGKSFTLSGQGTKPERAMRQNRRS